LNVRIEHVREREQFQAFAALLRDYEDALPADLKHGEDTALERVVEQYAGPRLGFLAMVDSAPIGCIAVEPLDATTAILKRLFVRAGNRNIGAGRMLVAEVIAHCREHGYTRIALDTHRDALPAAYELYRSMGFSECAQFQPVEYPCPTFMELRLR
jgi:GNAT superfamily N-acetyltransferase